MVLPSNSHVVDGAGVHILSGHHLLRLQGLVNTVDVNLYDAFAEATVRGCFRMETLFRLTLPHLLLSVFVKVQGRIVCLRQTALTDSNSV